MKTAEETGARIQTRPFGTVLVLVSGALALLASLVGSISLGAADIDAATVWEAVFNHDPELTSHQIIYELRLPRAIAGALVGAGLAVAGALMQGMTRNPLASPSIMGVNAGAAFALAVIFSFYPGMPFQRIILFSFAGAALGAGLVYGISAMSRGGLSPVRLALAGAAVSALLIAVSEGLAIYFRVAQDIAFWHAGGVAGTQWLQIRIMAPWVAAGLVGAFLLSRSVTVLSLGDEVASGLGQKTLLVKLLGSVVVLVLAGSSVAVVGAVGFVGLVIPHVARFLVGVDYRWIIPSSAVLGALLMVLADIGARMINPPYETPVGAITALIGVPFFLYLARKERREL